MTDDKGSGELIKVSVLVRALANTVFPKHDGPEQEASDQIFRAFFSGELGELHCQVHKSGREVYSPEDAHGAIRAWPPSVGGLCAETPEIDEFAKRGISALPDIIWQSFFIEMGWFSFECAKDLCRMKKWRVPVALSTGDEGRADPVKEGTGFSTAAVRKWFNEKQRENMDWTKPIADWIQDAVEEFSGLTFHRANKICREEIKKTQAGWLRRGRPSAKTQKDKPATN